MSNDNIDTTIKDMARLTVLSNRINPIQEKNLKFYPFIYFDGVKSVRLEYDLEHKKIEGGSVDNNSLVCYFLEIDEAAENKFPEKRFSHLESAIKSLFWNNIVVEVYFNGKIVYKSAKDVK